MCAELSSRHKRIGPYRVIEEIGRGGMGVVYAARHTRTGREVALKVTTSDSARALPRFRREVRLLGRLRHDGIVSLLDQGARGHTPWYAMTWVEGATLRHHIEDGPGYLSEEQRVTNTRELSSSTARDLGLVEALSATASIEDGAPTAILEHLQGTGFRLVETLELPAVPALDVNVAEFDVASIQRELEWLIYLCDVLAYMHGEGVVHRDIKPSNIVLAGSGRPVLLDFGLATEFGVRTRASQLEVIGLREGSANYIAPEQINGELVDARADLYAVGCMLYELVTGAAPFEHESLPMILMRHVGVPARPVSEFVLGVPDNLAHLIDSLLAKDPVDRPGHAGVIASALDALVPGSLAAFSPSEVKPYLFLPRFVGREDLLERMRASLLVAARGHGAVFEVVGDGGVGKTRLAAEVIRVARMRSATVVMGACVNADSTGGQSAVGEPLHAFGGVFDAIADRISSGDASLTNAPLSSRQFDLLALFSPSLRALSRRSRVATSPEITAIFEALEQGLDWLCEEGTLLLVLDDMQWADELSWSAARYLSERASQKRWVVMELTRPSERSSGALTQRYELGPISQSDVRVMVEQVLGARSVPDALVEHVITQSGCVPLVVSESLRLLVDCGVLQRTRHGAWMLDLDPEQLEEVASEHAGPSSMIRARLAALGARAARVAAAGALLGRAFTTDLLLDLLDSREDSEEALDARLGVLADAGVLLERDQDFVFCHDLVRQAAYELLGEAERVRFHARAAELLGALSRPDWLEVAYHWVSAGDRSRAALAYLDAGRAYVEQAAYLDARHAFETVAVISGEGSELALRAEYERVWLIGRARGAFPEIVTSLRALSPRIDRAASPVLAMLVLAALAEGLRQTGEFDEALDAVEFGASLAGGAEHLEGMDEARAHLAVTRANVYFVRGDYELALEIYQESLSVLERLGDPVRQSIVLSNMGNIMNRRGDVHAAGEYYDRAIRLAEEAGAQRHRVIAMGNLANTLRRSGELGRAEAIYLECLEVRRRDEDRLGALLVETNYTAVLIENGEWADARSRLERLLQTARELGIDSRIGTVCLRLGELCALQGQLGEAYEYINSSIALFERMGAHNTAWHGKVTMVWLYLLGGRFEGARQMIEQSLEVLGDVRDSRRWRATLFEHLARVELYDGNFDEALGALERADQLTSTLGEPVRRVVLAALRVHIDLARGVDPVDAVIIVQHRAAQLPQIAGEAKRALAMIDRAQRALVDELCRGFVSEDLPAEVRAAISR